MFLIDFHAQILEMVNSDVRILNHVLSLEPTIKRILDGPVNFVLGCY